MSDGRPRLPTAPRRRRSATFVAAVAALAVLAVAGTALSAFALRRSAPPTTNASALSDDDGGAPLFRLPALVPGQRVDRCIRVRHRGPAGTRIRLRADVHGRLAAHVRLRVDVGDGGGFGDCATFAGRRAYTGTLADAEEALHAAPVWTAATDDARTFRLVVTVPADLPQDAGNADADFTWQAVVPAAAPAAAGDRAANPPPVPLAVPPAPAGERPSAPERAPELAATPLASDGGRPSRPRGAGGEDSRVIRRPFSGTDAGTQDRRDEGRPGLPAELRRAVSGIATLTSAVAGRVPPAVAVTALTLLGGLGGAHVVRRRRLLRRRTGSAA